MGLLTSLKSFFSKKPATPISWEMTEEAYAMFPFHLLMTNQAPFDAWQEPGSHVAEGLRQFWKGSIIQYQLFVFHAVNGSTWGSEFAERLLRIQVRRLNESESGWGDLHEKGIRMIYNLIQRTQGAPMFFADKNGEQLEVPPENRLAVELLVTSPDSPFKTDRETANRVGPPTFPNEEDWKLAIDLENAKVKALEYFNRSATLVRFVASKDSHDA